MTAERMMTADDFIRKWEPVTQRERQASQTHFNDLCALLQVQTPIEANPTGGEYEFDKGLTTISKDKGFADVWKKGCFAFEYKGKHKDLNAAYAQLHRYSADLENPPLLIVSDMEQIIVYTAWTNTVTEKHVIGFNDLRDAKKRDLLKNCFENPERLKPHKTIVDLTKEAAKKFAAFKSNLEKEGHGKKAINHFVYQLVFCFFAQNIQLLPEGIIKSMFDKAKESPKYLHRRLSELFTSMSEGGIFGEHDIDWFNGGLFQNAEILSLSRDNIILLSEASRLNWSEIDPSIFGTLFEAGIRGEKADDNTAHFTEPHMIMKIITPVIIDPLRKEWAANFHEMKNTYAHLINLEQNIKAILDENAAHFKINPEEAKKNNKKQTDKINKLKKEIEAAHNAIKSLRDNFLVKLKNFKVLDPACGSGNFLYLALHALKDIERDVMQESEYLGLPQVHFEVSPHNVLGIEINPYAAELARVAIWIGEIQWMRKNNSDVSKNPILKPLETIQNRDALMNEDGSEAQWDKVDVIIGNPPFKGGKKLLSELGEDYMARLRALYAGRIPGLADLVTYWIEKARAEVVNNETLRVGLVTTNSVRDGFSRDVLLRVVDDCSLFHVWRDEAWKVDGAAVRVTILCYSKTPQETIMLDGLPASHINSNLIASNHESFDLTKAAQLKENKGFAFQGTTRSGPFDIKGEQARQWLKLSNPHLKSNLDILKPWISGTQITDRFDDKWIIDFGTDMSEDEACLYEKPFDHVKRYVLPKRLDNRNPRLVQKFWHYDGVRVGMRQAIAPLSRYIATVVTAKHRTFVWLNKYIQPDATLVAIARDDDISFGILHSRFHEIWSLRLGTTLEDRPRYTPTTTFETFPFPKGLELNVNPNDYSNPYAEKIAVASRRLNELRDNWLNPPYLIRREPEVVEGFPERILPNDEEAAKTLKERTLTKLYNERPAWLLKAHKTLDDAVADSYGFAHDISDNDLLEALLLLNKERQPPAKSPTL